MEIQVVNHAPASSAPRVEPDQRPSADAAATRRDPHPEIALPIPPDNGQRGAVSQSLLIHNANTVQRVERVLKPYGVTILPQPQPDARLVETVADDPQDGSSDQT
ncbi:MAG: hypothetical protein QNL92_10170 [Octadecabacter sp.]